MNLLVLKPNNTLLRKILRPIKKHELRTKGVQEEIDKLLAFVYGRNNKGEKRKRNKAMTVGLSANQVGINKRVSVVDLAIGRKRYSDIHVLINPEIIWHSKSQLERSEGCVNLPHIWGYVKRYKKIKVKAIDRSGNEILLTLSGWPSILLQHEIEHLNGELFIDKLKNPKKAHFVKDGEYKKYKKEKKGWRNFVDVSHLVKKSPRK